MRLLPILLLLQVLVAGCGVNSGNVDKLLASARDAQAAGRHGAAVIQLRNVLQKAPNHPEALYLLGVEYRAIGEYSQAATALKQALDLHYDPAKVVPPLCKSWLAIGQFQRALDQAAIDAGGDRRLEAELLTVRGQVYIGLEDHAEARKLLAQALVAQPEFADALREQARLAMEEGQPEDAARLLERAIASAPRDADAWILKGDLQRRSSPVDALATYRKLLEFDPENLNARLKVIALEIEAGNLDEAQTQFARARELYPAALILKYTEGLLEYSRGNYAGARVAIRDVLQVTPDHPPSVLLAGILAYALQSDVEAQRYLTTVLEREPDNLAARKMLAASYARGGDFRRALDVLAVARARAPNDPGILIVAGDYALRSNDLIRARDFYERAAKADPASVEARTGLGASKLASGDWRGGLADLEAAARLDPAKVEADTLLVMVHLQRKEFDEALKAAQALERKLPADPRPQNLKAAAYLGKGDATGARKALERALELQATYSPAAINLAQLDLNERNPRSARQRLEGVLAKDAGSVPTLVALADLAPRMGASPTEEVEWLKRAQQAGPDKAQPTIALARRLAESGDLKKALELAQQALASDPNSTEALEAVGAIQLAAGNAKEAVVTFDGLVNRQPRSATARYRLASAQAAVGDDVGAAKSLHLAMSLQAGYVDAQKAMVELELRKGRTDEAMQITQQVRRQEPKSYVGYMLEGDVLAAEKKFAQAAKAFEAAYELERNRALAIRMHKAYADAGRVDVADARLAQWLAIAPEDTIVRLYSAEVSLQRGAYPKAIEQYEWLRQKQPENGAVLNNLAWSYYQIKDPRALPTAERAYQLDPGNPSVADTLGWMLVEQGNAARGVELLQAAVAAAPKVPEIRFHLAQGYAKAGEPGKARSELERLLGLETAFPERAEATALLEALKK